MKIRLGKKPPKRVAIAFTTRCALRTSRIFSVEEEEVTDAKDRLLTAISYHSPTLYIERLPIERATMDEVLEAAREVVRDDPIRPPPTTKKRKGSK